MAATSTINPISSADLNAARELFQDTGVQQILTTNKINVRPVVSFQISRDFLTFKKQLLIDLNQKLFNLKVSAERLNDPSFLSSLHFISVVSSDTAVRAATENFNSDAFQSKLASASAEEITGNASANEYTALTGISGYLLIEGQRITVGTNPYETKSNKGYADSLMELKNRINSLDIESRADIINGKLVIFSPAGRTASAGDFTYGGKTDGLQLTPVPQREVSDVLSNFITGQNPRITPTQAEIQQLQSFKAEDISGNKQANGSTPLYGISGNVIINSIPVAFDTSGISDSMQSFADRVNALSSQLNAAAYVDTNNRLVLYSTDRTKLLDVQDKTTGGLAGGSGGLGLSRSANSGSMDTSAASTVGLNDISIMGIAQRQKNVSYSAAEITGISSATETTSLGISGNLVINGTRVYLMSYESLKDVASVINGMGAGVTASVVQGKLILESNSANSVGFTLTDNSTGGARGGIGIGTMSRDVRSVPLQVITGNMNVDENTFMDGISGSLQFKSANTTLAAGVGAGVNIITVAGASGLQAGDVLTLNPGQANEEERKITALSGTTITLNVVTAFAHAGGETITNIRTLKINLQGTTDTPQRLVDAINNDGGMGVTAAIENGRIVLRASQPAMPSITDATTGGYAGTSGSFGFQLSSSTAVQPQNAVYQMNGVTHSQPTNSVSGGVPGVQFQLQSALYPGSDSVAISTQVTEQDNVTNIEALIKNFAIKFNESLKTLNVLTQFDTGTMEEGSFFASAGLEGLKNMLVSAVTMPVKLLETNQITLEDIGARMDEKLNGILNSTLTMDEDKLKKQIAQNLTSVVSLFNSQYNGIGARISTLLNALILNDGVAGVDTRLEDKFTLFKQLEQMTFSSFGKEKQGQIFSEQV